VQSVYCVLLSLLRATGVRLADDFAGDVNLGFELVYGLLRELASQSFALFALTHNELVLSRLEVLEVALVQVLLPCHHLASV